MSDLKFKQGETVLVDGKEELIVVAKKNFSTKKISYQLKGGRIVAEEDVKKAKLSRKSGSTKTNPLHVAYKKATGKDVPNNKKKDEAWLKGKIADATKPEEVDVEAVFNMIKELDMERLEEKVEKGELTLEHLKAVVDENEELIIDVDEYDNANELLIEICEILDENEPTDAEKYAALAKLEFDELKTLVQEKEFDIEVEDYENVEDLLVAVCEELEIEIPTEN